MNSINDLGPTIYSGPPQGHIAAQKMPRPNPIQPHPAAPAPPVRDSVGASAPRPQPSDDIRADARRADREDHEKAELFADMVRTEAWQVYSEMLQTLIQKYGDELMEPTRGMDGVLASLDIKGTIRGLLLAKSLPASTIETMKGVRGGAPDGESE